MWILCVKWVSSMRVVGARVDIVRGAPTNLPSQALFHLQPCKMKSIRLLKYAPMIKVTDRVGTVPEDIIAPLKFINLELSRWTMCIILFVYTCFNAHRNYQHHGAKFNVSKCSLFRCLNLKLISTEIDPRKLSIYKLSKAQFSCNK